MHQQVYLNPYPKELVLRNQVKDDGPVPRREVGCLMAENGILRFRSMGDILLPGRPMKVRDVIKLIEDDGWYLVVTKGSHRQ
jgi:hypothetical protein